MSQIGALFGIGVGPGPAGMISLAALEALQRADLIMVPRARNGEKSVALQCLAGLDLSPDKFREVVYNMDPERAQIDEHYQGLAAEMAIDLKNGKTIAYITIGDSLTYSTFSYLLEALLALMPGLAHKTFAGITSYAAVAAAHDWPLGQGKETTLILPCPDDMEVLSDHINNHDVIVLMKIGSRLASVLKLLKRINVIDNCVFASRIGLPGEVCSDNLAELEVDDSLGYLSTMLIRRDGKRAKRGSSELSSSFAHLPQEEVVPGVP